MKNKELFDKTIGILVKAYQNDTLEHETCYACAVGNLVAAGLGCGFIDASFEKTPGTLKWDNGMPYPATRGWGTVFTTVQKSQKFIPSEYRNLAKKQIMATGYSLGDVMKIEYDFETASPGNTPDERMFNGLMAVCDALMQIHEANETEISEAKALFVTA